MGRLSETGFLSVGLDRKLCKKSGELIKVYYATSVYNLPVNRVLVDKPGALSEILWLRNEQYKQVGKIHRSLMMRDPNGNRPKLVDRTSSTGGYRYDQCGYYSSARCLKTRKSRGIFITVVKWGKAGAKIVADQIYDDNVACFASMVEDYQKDTFEKGMILARREARTLKPCMQTLAKSSDKRWAKVYKRHYPKGLNNTYDPFGILKQ